MNLFLSEETEKQNKAGEANVTIQMGQEKLVIFDAEYCGALVEEWVEKKRRPKILTNAERYPAKETLRKNLVSNSN